MPARVNIAPTLNKIEAKSPEVDLWFKEITNRVNIYNDSIDPTASTIPDKQWILHRNSTSGTTSLWYNWGGVVSQIGAGATTGTGTRLMTDVDPLISSGNLYFVQVAPTSKATGSTITAADFLKGITQYTSAAGSLTTASASNIITSMAQTATNSAFRWSLINTGTGTCTITSGTGVSFVGSNSITNGTSGQFIIRKSGASSVVFYRAS